MRKVIRLTESELIGLVRQVINETKYKISKDERIVISDTENFLQVVPLPIPPLVNMVPTQSGV